MRIFHVVLRHTERGYIEAAVAADSTATAIEVFEDVAPDYDEAGTTLSIECAGEVFAHSEFMSAPKSLAIDLSEWTGEAGESDDGEDMPEDTGADDACQPANFAEAVLEAVRAIDGDCDSEDVLAEIGNLFPGCIYTLAERKEVSRTLGDLAKNGKVVRVSRGIFRPAPVKPIKRRK